MTDPDFRITLRGMPTEDGTTVYNRLRRFLKSAKRGYGLRCLSIEPVPADPAAADTSLDPVARVLEVNLADGGRELRSERFASLAQAFARWREWEAERVPGAGYLVEAMDRQGQWRTVQTSFPGGRVVAPLEGSKAQPVAEGGDE